MGMQLSSKYVQLNQQLIMECATGLDLWVDVAKRYGFTEDEWSQIEKRPEVIAAIEKAKKEMYDSGVTFKTKSKVMAEQLLNDVFASALSADTPVKDKVSALQAISRLGGLETGPQVQAQGSGFSISINLPQMVTVSGPAGAGNQIDATEVIEANHKDVTAEEASVHLEFKDDKGREIRGVAGDSKRETARRAKKASGKAKVKDSEESEQEG